MIAIQDKLISEDVFKVHFVCDLNACQGACCWEGDFGAPVAEDELDILDEIWPQLKNYIPAESMDLLEKNGPFTYKVEINSHVTNLRKDGACVFMSQDEQGIAHCGIENAYRDGIVNFQKPISCHLYPIRVLEKPDHGFTAINYDKWKICNPACKNGKNLGVPLYKFLKTSIERKFGEAFYKEMELVAGELNLE